MPGYTAVLAVAASVFAAALAAGIGHLLRPALARRRTRQLSAARSNMARLTVEGQFAVHPDLWDQFLTAHSELRADQKGGT